MIVSERNLALAVLSLAESAHMPETFWQTDSRVRLAREALGVRADERYSRKLERMLEAFNMTRGSSR